MTTRRPFTGLSGMVHLAGYGTGEEAAHHSHRLELGVYLQSQDVGPGFTGKNNRTEDNNRI